MAAIRPQYLSKEEQEFFESTSKRDLFEMLRAYAVFDPEFDSAEDALMCGAWIDAARVQRRDKTPAFR